MNVDNGKFTKIKKFLAFVFGIAVLWASIIFSKNGFEFKTSGELADYSWIGWVLAFAATVSQFMMNSSFKKINWTILILGLVSYIYSIYTNMLGFHSLRETESIWNILNVCGSFFMDVFPEVAISWALDESKVGDLFGNLLKSAQTPEMLSKTQEIEKRVSSGFSERNIPSNIPRKNQNNGNSNGSGGENNNGGGSSNQLRNPAQNSNQGRQNARNPEPTYHLINMNEKEKEGFDA